MRETMDLFAALPQSRWWHPIVSSPTAVERLWCFPGLASDTTSWAPLASRLGSEAEVLALCAPGHQERADEAPLAHIDDLADAIATELTPLADERDVFLGHGMGALLAYEVAQRRRLAGRGEPRALVVCSAHPPHHRWSGPQLHRLPPRDFLAGVERYYGPLLSDSAEHPEQPVSLLRALRADLEAVETYRPPNLDPLSCPLLAISGTSDPLVPSAAMLGWKVHTTGRCEVVPISGGHFIVSADTGVVAARIRSFLDRI